MVYASPFLGLLRSYKAPWLATPPTSPRKDDDTSLPVNNHILPVRCTDPKLAFEQSSPIYAPIQPPRRRKADTPPQQKSPTRKCLTLTAIQTSGLPTPPPTPPDSPTSINRKSPPASPQASPTTCHVQRSDAYDKPDESPSAQRPRSEPWRLIARRDTKPGTTWGGLYSSTPKMRVEDSDGDHVDIKLSARRQTATPDRAPLTEIANHAIGRRGRPPKQDYNSAVIEGAEFFRMAIYRMPSPSEHMLQHHRTLLRSMLKSAETTAARTRAARRTKSPTDDAVKEPPRLTDQAEPINLLKVEQNRLRFYRDARNPRRALPVVPEPRSLTANVNEPPAKYHVNKPGKPSKLSQCTSLKGMMQSAGQSAKKVKIAALVKLQAQIDGPVNYGLGLDFGRPTSPDEFVWTE